MKQRFKRWEIINNFANKTESVGKGDKFLEDYRVN